ncbi:uncharacterized protein L969DRAFT_14156 [Mixia osmundae IAM 14324]|uniref:Poly(A) RNA polymerase mitochondrial-like central palm domain-containing protein n=1 Tax=Mixia osmundae (strain CBS 9802 / IAM 14324 / JCM 22182 / KY 12970) TaxID=764103 RepID=G7E3U3_MIXOS|nr:uncharacterized protein L969DRAFT_14156 [Mixia osmundae IAM 14324]KEI41948.1 hypothetical protein L969DRAFT_14156 [Mixia osmundae IAM 14324]GAA97503.1 hypothetical protein E5Q_04181 [Mixia osmundae IAM 14324]
MLTHRLSVQYTIDRLLGPSIVARQPGLRQRQAKLVHLQSYPYSHYAASIEHFGDTRINISSRRFPPGLVPRATACRDLKRATTPFKTSRLRPARRNLRIRPPVKAKASTVLASFIMASASAPTLDPAAAALAAAKWARLREARRERRRAAKSAASPSDAKDAAITANDGTEENTRTDRSAADKGRKQSKWSKPSDGLSPLPVTSLTDTRKRAASSVGGRQDLQWALPRSKTAIEASRSDELDRPPRRHAAQQPAQSDTDMVDELNRGMNAIVVHDATLLSRASENAPYNALATARQPRLSVQRRSNGVLPRREPRPAPIIPAAVPLTVTGPKPKRGKAARAATRAGAVGDDSASNTSVLMAHIDRSLNRMLCSADVLNLSLGHTMSSASALARNRLVAKISSIVQDRFGAAYTAQAFGSHLTGLDNEHSDLDLTILDANFPFGVGPEQLKKTGPIYNLRKLEDILRRRGAQKVTVVRHTLVPIIKFEMDGIKVDLNVNERLGIYNSKLIAEYCRISPIMRPLCVFVKFWSKRRELNDPAGQAGKKSFSSYALILLVIAYLQQLGELPNLQDMAEVMRAPLLHTRYSARLSRARPGKSNTVDSWEQVDISFAQGQRTDQRQESAIDFARIIGHFFASYADLNMATNWVSIREHYVGPRNLENVNRREPPGKADALCCIADPFLLARNTVNIDATVAVDFKAELQRVVDMCKHKAPFHLICARLTPDERAHRYRKR